MKIKIVSNLNSYNSRMFDTLISIPRKGESVKCLSQFHNILIQKSLPIQLEVKKVIYEDNFVEIELNYSEIQQKIQNLKK